MFAMMPLGMLTGLVLSFIAGIWLGAMEAMVPIMVSGELSGMVVGMICAMDVLSFRQAALLGAASGLAGILLVWLANGMLRGISRETGIG